MVKRKPRLLSVCSGIGGIDLAALWAGFELAGQVEIDDFPTRVLEARFPDVPRARDLTTLRGDELYGRFGTVDLLAGGIPCQGNSVAGARRGRDDERNLWPAVARILQEARASGAAIRWLLVENVSGLRSASVVGGVGADSGSFGDILRDLAALGYRAGWASYGAGDVGAPHRRERVFLIAHYAGRSPAAGLADATQRREYPDPRRLLGSAGTVTGREGHQAGDTAECCSEGSADDVANARSVGAAGESRAVRSASGSAACQGPSDWHAAQYGGATLDDANGLRREWGQGGLGGRDAHASLAALGRETAVQPQAAGERDDAGDVADAAQRRLRRGRASGNAGQSACGSETDASGASGASAAVADTTGAGLSFARRPSGTARAAQGGAGSQSGPERCGGVVGELEYAGGARLEGEQRPHPGGGDDPQARRSTGRPDADGGAGQTQPRLGRGADGLPDRLDNYQWRGEWPTGPGQAQRDWEPPRVTPATERQPDRAARLKALGNAVVPAQIAPVLAAIHAAMTDLGELDAVDAVDSSEPDAVPDEDDTSADGIPAWQTTESETSGSQQETQERQGTLW